MLTLFAAIIVMGVSVTAFVYSLPRGGKPARFVGSEWEGYIVVGMVSATWLGALFTVTSLIQLLQ